MRFRDAIYWSTRGCASYVVTEPDFSAGGILARRIYGAFSSRLNVGLDSDGEPIIINGNHYAAECVPDLIENSEDWEPFPAMRDAVSLLGELA